MRQLAPLRASAVVRVNLRRRTGRGVCAPGGTWSARQTTLRLPSRMERSHMIAPALLRKAQGMAIVSLQTRAPSAAPRALPSAPPREKAAAARAARQVSKQQL